MYVDHDGVLIRNTNPTRGHSQRLCQSQAVILDCGRLSNQESLPSIIPAFLKPGAPGFLKTFVCVCACVCVCVCVCVFACVCVSAPQAIKNYSREMKLE